MDVFSAASPVSHSRLGVIVPKHGHRIVDRNLLKRRLREILRRRVIPGLDAAGIHKDVLVRARRSAYEVDFTALEREVKASVEELCSRSS